jgi:tetratricopeptide (TPR) repeat protein
MKRDGLMIKWLLAWVAFLLLLLAVYSNHFDNGFYFDDTHTVVTNGHITSLRNIPSFFADGQTFSSLPANQSYRPVATTLLAIDYWMGGGLDPFYFHLSQFFWYVIQLILMFVMFRTTFNVCRPGPWNDGLAFLGVAFYGLHAANAETINYIISRTDSFSTLCVVASLVLFQISATRKRYLYLVTMVLGIYTKQTAVMFGPVLLLYVLLFEEEFFERGSFGKALWKKLRNALIASAPAIILGSGVFLFNQLIMTPTATVSSNSTVSRLDYLITQLWVVTHYLGNFILPVRLSADPDIEIITQLFDPRVLFGLFVVIGLLVAAWLSARTRETRPIAFGILWFFIALLPTSSLVPLYQMANDHRTFFPYIGLVMATTWAAGLLFTMLRRKVDPLVLTWGVGVLILLLLGGHAFGTYRRNEVWGSKEALWHDVTLKSPRNGRGLMNYGLVLMEQGKHEEALNYYQRAQVLWPRFLYNHIYMGILKGAWGRGTEAEQHFLSALKFGPANPEVYLYYGRWLDEMGRLSEARNLLEKGLGYSPEHRSLKDQLESVRVQEEGTPAERIAFQSKKAIENPTPSNHLNLSLAYYHAGLYVESIESCRSALEVDPDLAAAYNNICSAQVHLGEYTNAIAACTRALEIDPGFLRARANLRWAQDSLEADPDKS